MNNEKMEARKKIALVAIVIAITFGLQHYLDKLERDRLEKVQSGEVELVCLLKDGERVIPPEMVTGLLDNTWVFKNGSAKRCRIIK